MDPYLIAAGGFVLVGLGCLGADLYSIATSTATPRNFGQQKLSIWLLAWWRPEFSS